VTTLVDPNTESMRAVRFAVDDGAGSFLTRIVRAREFGVILVCAAFFTIFSVFADGFLSADNLLTIMQQVAILGVVAVGMTYVMVAGEIDLSVGSMYGLLGIVLARLVTGVGIPVWGSVVIVIVLGVLLGALNGWVAVRFKIPSFVVTLAGLVIYKGAGLLLSGGLPVLGSKIPEFKAVFAGFPLPSLSAQTIWMIVVVVIGAIVLTRTKLGSDVFSTGGNRDAAQGAGINTGLIKIEAFAITGGLCGLAAVMTVALLGSATPLAGQGLELSVIAAVVIGGASLYGGVGTVWGSFVGAILTGMIANALVLFGVDSNWQFIATGFLILGAVLINTAVSNRASR
jgi:ribose transport system permease protein